MLKSEEKLGFAPDYAVPPGVTLKEVMESLDMTQKDLAVRTDVTVQTLNRIFKGEQPISYETSNKLEMATGVPSRMWNNLEAQYREQLAKLKELKQLESDLDWLNNIPIKELIQRNAIVSKDDKTQMLREILKFFGVSSLSAWHNIWSKPAVAARRSQCLKPP
jgi:addiction module HigA family antidote